MVFKTYCREPRGKGGWDNWGDWDQHIYTIDTMYKIGKGSA